MSTVLVTGASGNVGSRVVGELLARDARVRAFVRDRDKAATVLPAGTDLAFGDFTDAASLRTAFEGVDRVFLTSSNSPREVEDECAVIDAAAEAGVSRLVKLSAIDADPGSPLPGVAWHGQIEEYVGRSGVPAVVLRSTWFMTNLFASAEAVAHTGSLFAPADGGRIAMIHPGDVAASAAAVLAPDGHSATDGHSVTDGHEGHTYLVTGGEALTYEDVAATLTEATGRTVTFVDVPEEAAQQAFVEAGMPDWLVTHIVGVFRLIREGALAQTTDTVLALTGRPPRTLAHFAREHAGLFGARP
ncbi:MAG: SDR family oxidoreductase [Actinomycetes bacterium]